MNIIKKIIVSAVLLGASCSAFAEKTPLTIFDVMAHDGSATVITSDGKQISPTDVNQNFSAVASGHLFYCNKNICRICYTPADDPNNKGSASANSGTSCLTMSRQDVIENLKSHHSTSIGKGNTKE